jgi:sirohydrochlorin ferrochelatase
MPSPVKQRSAVCAALLLSLGVVHAADDPPAVDAHAGHAAGHAGHAMEPWMYEALRKRVDIYKEYTDAQIDESMVRMGPDYTVLLSPPGTRGSTGVLVLAHGFGKEGDESFNASLRSVAGNYPMAVSYGMSMTTSSHIQEAIDHLKSAGAERLIVVPALSSRASDDQLRQWQYMFGLTDDPGYLETPRLKIDMPFEWTPALEDHPLVVEMIADHAREISTDPAREVVILVSHGPTAAADNERNMALLARIAAALKEQGGYAEVKYMSMQNDAPPKIRAANGRKLRTMVEEASRAGKRVLIVTNLNTPRSIQHQVEDDIRGTTYLFNKKGLVQHPNYARWVDAVVREAMADG